jgi:hypothetical protein
MVQGYPKQIVVETLISKITRAKRAEGVAQMVEHLLCKCKVLSSNLNTPKNKSYLTSYAIIYLLLHVQLQYLK